MASYKPYEMDVTSKSGGKNSSLPSDTGNHFSPKLKPDKFEDHIQQESDNITNETAISYIVKSNQNRVPFNYESAYNLSFADREADDPPATKMDIHNLSHMATTSSDNQPVEKKYMGFQMTDLDTASHNLVKNLDSDDDIENETGSVLEEECIKNETGTENSIEKNSNALMMKEKLLDSNIENVPFILQQDDPRAMFNCTSCEVWFPNLRDWIDHIKAEHADVKLPGNFESLLYKQRKTILGVERTAVDLLSVNKFKAVTRLLTSSKGNLESFQSDIFNSGKCNVFRKFLLAMYARVENLMKKKLEILKRVKPKKKYHKKKDNITIQNIQKVNGKLNGIKEKRNSISRVSVSSGFSSDDDICLKDSILKERGSTEFQRTLASNESVTESNIKEKCISFYAVPERVDGKPLSFFEIAAVRRAVKDIWSGKFVQMDLLQHIKIMRYERECGEHLKDDVLFVGYSSKKHGHGFKPKALSDLFNSKGRLNDKTRSHGKKDAESESSLSDDAVESDVENDTFMDHDDMKDEFMNIDDDSSSDNYDDGFNEATAHLLEDKEVACILCSDSFESKKLLKAHVLEVHTPDWEKNRYVARNSQQLKYACITCGECFAHKGKLLAHELKMHQTLKLYNCSICHAGFPTALKRDKHLLTHSARTSKIIKCGFCMGIFEDYAKLKEHFEAAHPGVQDVKMEVEEGVDVKDDLESLFTPKKTIKFDKQSADAPQCDVCSRKFTSFGRLQQHTAIVHQNVAFRKGKRKVKKQFQKDGDASLHEDIDDFIEVNV